MKNPNSQPVLTLRPEIQLAIRLADEFFAQHSQELIICWTTGGAHMKGSLHFKRRAVDILPPKKRVQVIIDRLKYVLGPDYDVVDETDEEPHIHIEWDPK
jgi:hypothetical protein